MADGGEEVKGEVKARHVRMLCITEWRVVLLSCDTRKYSLVWYNVVH